MTTDHSGNILGINIQGNRHDLRAFTVYAGGIIVFRRGRKAVYSGGVDMNPAPPPELPVNGEYSVDVVGSGTFSGSTNGPYPLSNMITLIFVTSGAAHKFCSDMRNIIEQLENDDSANEFGGSDSPTDENAINGLNHLPASNFYLSSASREAST